ncbi:DUF2970 domain-containing protein [Stutzerimonas azotifigens]|uniref:DUF2970 domain-containing protein n=1 Tax=Stutzerimonas azotifigens TaxID=291995 RepID=UPI000429FD08|nr:DUF2970 domain-containing protein [Stutzerimonas azotifigens]
MTERSDDEKPLSFRELLGSVLAAALGVQSGRNRARDFSRGKASHFIFMGLAFTALFALVLFGIVRLVLYFAGM